MARKKKQNPTPSTDSGDVTVTTNVTSPVPLDTAPTVPPVIINPSPAPTQVVTSTSTSTVPSAAFSQKSIWKSKKFFYGTLAMSLASAIYFLNIILVTKYPFAQASYLSLFNTMMSFIAGITSGILGIHSFMDYTTAATNVISNTAASTISKATNITKAYTFTDDQKAQNVDASRTKLPGS